MEAVGVREEGRGKRQFKAMTQEPSQSRIRQLADRKVNRQ